MRSYLLLIVLLSNYSLVSQVVHLANLEEELVILEGKKSSLLNEVKATK